MDFSEAERRQAGGVAVVEGVMEVVFGVAVVEGMALDVVVAVGVVVSECGRIQVGVVEVVGVVVSECARMLAESSVVVFGVVVVWEVVVEVERLGASHRLVSLCCLHVVVDEVVDEGANQGESQDVKWSVSLGVD